MLLRHRESPLSACECVGVHVTSAEIRCALCKGEVES